MTLIDAVREELRAAELVRRPDEPGAGARPWLPPAWKHPDDGAVGPGDAERQEKPVVAWDDGLVVSLFHAPGIPPELGAEERRIDGVDIRFRGNAVPAIVALERLVRLALLGNPPEPGGRTDFMLGGAAGVYCIQARQWSAFQPISTADGVFTFTVGYTFETRAV